MREKGSAAVLILVIIVAILFIAGAYFLGINQKNQQTSQTLPLTAASSFTPKNSSGSTSLANPASVNCTQKGGTLSIESLTNGAQYGLCHFSDDQACEEWALYYGNCPVGGVKTIGFTNKAQDYCAWLGGQTLAIKDAQCNLPNGKVCLDNDLYSGQCSNN